MAKKDFKDFTYGVGLEMNATSFKQVKDELKLNLDTLSKMVKSYGKILKIDPNADLSKLYEEMRKIQGIVSGIENSDNSFGDFVDKGVLGRIAALENNLAAISSTSQNAENSMSGLASAVASITESLKAAGVVKFPATFENLFDGATDKSAQIKNVQNQITAIESELVKLQDLWENLGFPKKTKNWNEDEIFDWIARIDDIKSELSSVSGIDSKQLSLFVSELETISPKLASAMASMSSDQLKSFKLNDEYVISEIEDCIQNIKTKKQKLDSELQSLQAEQDKYVTKNKVVNQSLGNAKNEDGSNYTLRAKVIPDTDDAAWVKTINDTIKNVEPQLKPVALTPTFSKSKNIKKEVEGNLAQINHAVNVDIQVTDNIEQFNQKIQNIDASIKNAKAQLEKEGSFKIRFEYEEGGKFKDAAYAIINKFKRIDTKFYIANGKTFIENVKGLKKSVDSKLKEVRADVIVGNEDAILTDIDALRKKIDEKIGNIGVNLFVKNSPDFMSQINGVASSINVDSGINNAANGMEQLSDAAKKAQEDLTKTKEILQSLNTQGFNSSWFTQLGDINANGKRAKGSKEKLETLLNKYKELQARVPDDLSERWQELYPEANGDIQAAIKMSKAVEAELKKVESELNLYLQKQIAYAQSRQAAAEEILKTEKEIVATKKQKVSESQSSEGVKSNKELATSAEEAKRQVRSLNGTISHQKKVLKDLESNGFDSQYFSRLGEWDKETGTFQRNSQEIQQLLNRYKELKTARESAGGGKAVGEEASIRGKLSAILTKQKKHASEIIAKNQEELESVKKIANEYKQVGDNKAKATKTDNTQSTKHLDELIEKLNKAKEALRLLKQNGLDALSTTGLGDVNKRLESAGSSQTFDQLIQEYNQLIAKRDELEKRGVDVSHPEYVAAAQQYKVIEQQLSVIHKDQLKYTQSRIRGLNAEITKEKELLGVKTQQAKESNKQETQGGSANKTQTGVNTASATVKLDGATLNSLAKDTTLKSIDGKINNIINKLGNGIKINGSNISIEASNVSVSGKGSTAGVDSKSSSKDPTIKEVKLSTVSSYSQQLVALEERIKRAGLYTDDLQQKFVNLHTQLNAIQVQDDADTYKFDLDRFKEDFEQLKTYDKLYQDFIKSQTKQIQLHDQISTSNDSITALQEQLKIEEEISKNIETQLTQQTTLYDQRARQLAIDEAIKKANQEIAKSNAAQNDKDINKQNVELTKLVDNAQKNLNNMQHNMNNFKIPMADSAVAKLKEYEQLLNVLKIKQQEVVANPDLLKDSDYSKGFNELLLKMQGIKSQFATLQRSSESFLSKIKSAEDIKPLGSTFDATNLTQLHNAMHEFADQTGAGAAKLIEFNDIERTATFEIQNGKGQVQQLTVAYDEAINSLGRYTKKTKESLSESQKFFNSLKHSFGNVARYVASFGSVYRLFAVIKQGVTYVKEIDSALTELKKVTDETDASYDKFLKNMSKTSGVIGSTVSDLTTIASEWARLGYSMEEAGQLAESTAILLNVSEFEDATTASEALISTMQANITCLIT